MNTNRDRIDSNRRSLARWAWLASALFILGACASSSPTTERLEELGGEACPESEFTCITLAVPLDHASKDDDRTIDVRFAVRPAKGTTEGVLVVAVGGPGGSGVTNAPMWLSAIDQNAFTNLDVVFFDARGIGMFDDADCPQAETRLDQDWEELPADRSVLWEPLVDTFDRFMNDCSQEMGHLEELVLLGTSQAIEDLEFFRQAMGYGQLIMYGESYGTSFALAYASAHPAAVERLVLDGAIDPMLTGIERAASEVAATREILDELFRACDRDLDCRADMGAPANEVYESLMKTLEQEAVIVSFPVEPGSWEDFSLTATDVAATAFVSAYSEGARMLFMRALSAYSRDGDVVPMLRLTGIDPGEGLSGVMNFAVNCLDMTLPGETESEELAALEVAWDSISDSASEQLLLPLTCSLWPGFDHTQATGELSDLDRIPTLVVASDADPVTTYEQAISVSERLGQGHLLTVRGGSHVMYGWGNTCVDDAVTAFIVDGSVPSVTVCEAEMMSPYFPLFPGNHRGLPTEDLIRAIDDEIYNLPEFFMWDGDSEMVVGCDHGGGVTITGDGPLVDFVLERCGFDELVAVTGAGSWDFEAGVSRIEVTIAGDECSYEYRQDWDSGDVVVKESCR